jgi:hypothetical protein
VVRIFIEVELFHDKRRKLDSLLKTPARFDWKIIMMAFIEEELLQDKITN